MAEIGLIAGVIAIVGAGTKLSIAIFDFATTIGSAGRELQIVGTEISILCSVLRQVQSLLEHAHFHPSKIAIESLKKIKERCEAVFEEIAEILTGFRTAKGDALFPPPDFLRKIKWTFSKRSKVLVLRSTLESCKLTLSVMLNTMQLAESVSRRRQSLSDSEAEVENNKAMTQSLVISQQCAVEQLEHHEEEFEKEEEQEEKIAMHLHEDEAGRTNVQRRRRSRGRLMQMFSGLSLITDLPTPTVTPHRLSTHSTRASVWLDNMLAPENQATDIHPGILKQKRLSSVGTANAPLELLRKWTDQGGKLNPEGRTQVPYQAADVDKELLKFSFAGPKSVAKEGSMTEILHNIPRPGLSRASSAHILPTTARGQSIGFHLGVGVDGSLETYETETLRTGVDDSYEVITQAILREHAAATHVRDVTLCIWYGGKIKVLQPFEKPLDVLRSLAERESDPRLFVRQKRNEPP
jgi:hypothetical protein